MNILLVSSSFRGGGITSYAHEVVRSFSSQYTISIMIGDDTTLPFDPDKYKIYRVESENCSVDNARYTINLINKEIRPDVILNSNSKLLSLITPYLNNNIRVITVSHSLRYNEADIAGLNSQYADSIIALSHFNKEYLCKQFKIIDHSKVKVVYNFVEEYPNAQIIRERKKENRILKIVFAGGTSAPKRPELILTIAQKLLRTDRALEFYFMPNNTPTHQKLQPYNSVAQLFPRDARMIFTGRIPREEAEKISSEANIFLVPSRREGCPMAMIEAMRVGCIIITSDYKNACQEMVIHGESGLIIPHDTPDNFLSTIIDIIDNHSNYKSMYEKCYERYRAMFSFSPWYDQMNHIIQSHDYAHTDRLSAFDEKIYKKDLSWIGHRMSYNKYHMLVFETLKSAIPLYFKYIFKEIQYVQ